MKAPFDRIRHPHRLLPWLLCGAFLLWFVVNLLTVTRYPLPVCDEANHANAAYQFATRGVFALPLVGVQNTMSQNNSLYGRLWMTGQAGLFLLFGTSLFTSRLSSLLAWPVTSVLVLAVASRVYGNRLFAALAALCFAFSLSVFVRWRIGWFYPWASAAILLVFYLYLNTLKESGLRPGIFLGLALPLSLDIHWGPLFFLPGLAALLAYDTWSTGNWNHLRSVLIGGIAGSFYWIAARLYPDPALTLYQWIVEVPVRQFYRVDRGGLGVEQLSDYIVTHYFRLNNGIAGIDSLLALGGIVTGMLKHISGETRLIFYYLLAWVLFVLLYPGKGYFHVAFWLPFMSIMAARLMWALAELAAQWLKKSGRNITAAAAAAILCSGWIGLNIVANSILLWNYWDVSWPYSMATLRSKVPPDGAIFAEEAWWYAFTDRDMIGQISLPNLQRHYDADGVVTSEDLKAYLAANDVHYVMLTDDFHCRDLSRFSVREMVDEYCYEIASDTGFYSASTKTTVMRIYRCDLSNGMEN